MYTPTLYYRGLYIIAANGIFRLILDTRRLAVVYVCKAVASKDANIL